MVGVSRLGIARYYSYDAERTLTVASPVRDTRLRRLRCEASYWRVPNGTASLSACG